MSTNIGAGDVICAKSITRRVVVEMRESKKTGRQTPLVNTFSYAFQPKSSLLSKVGVFLFLGTYPEGDDDAMMDFAERQLRALGWTEKEPVAAVAVASVAADQAEPTPREKASSEAS